MSKNPICFALDFPTLGAAADFVGEKGLCPYIGAVKVGLELFISSGPRSLELFGSDAGLEVILDLKLHDIPETVGRAVRAGGDIGAKYMTLHVQQKAALEAALRAAEPYGITLLGVTILTSMSCEDLAHLEMERRLGDTVNSVIFRAGALAGFAHECGLRGFVCSPVEVGTMKERFPDSFFLVPGVRPAGSDTGDQKRTGTPRQAVDDGASLIVVGRPIRDAKDPVQAAKNILAEINA
jgi:orotidine-5'-phosphate decarboxylase